MTLMSANSTQPRRLTAASSQLGPMTAPGRYQRARPPQVSQRPPRGIPAAGDSTGGGSSGPAPAGAARGRLPGYPRRQRYVPTDRADRAGRQAGGTVTVTGGAGGEGASVPAGPEHQPGTLAPPGPGPGTGASQEPGPAAP